MDLKDKEQKKYKFLKKNTQTLSFKLERKWKNYWTICIIISRQRVSLMTLQDPDYTVTAPKAFEESVTFKSCQLS